MLSLINKVENLVGSVNDLVDTKVALIKLKATDKVSSSISGIASVITVAVFIGISLIIISFGFAYFIGSKLNNVSYGFFIIGVLYAVIGLLVFINRKKWIQIPIRNLIIEKLM